MKAYATWIDFATLTPPDGMPTGLAFIFVNDVPFAKLAIIRPANPNGESSFRVGIIAPDGLKIDVYVYGKKHKFVRVEDNVLQNSLTFGHGSHNIGFMELRQDMRGSGFNPEKFPEIASFLEID